MSLVVRVSGVDITDDVMIADARFTMANGPNPGDFEFFVKDVNKTYAFRAGEPIEVDFDSVRVFEGYVLIAAQKHGFSVDDSVTEGPGAVERIWGLKGTDLNILFRKRFVFNQANPSNAVSLDLAAGTSDLTYLDSIINHLTLDEDNLTFDFHHVGSPNPDRDGIAISVGDSWERVMSLTAEIPGGIWGIRPPRTVYYEDDDTETAPFAISDTPDNVTSFGYANFDWLNDGSRLVNDARIWGVGLGQDHLTYVNVQDAASIAEHGRWQNGNGWRYNLYRQTSVQLVANSLVYGSPQNLHGPKDDSKVVTCRIKKAGIMPGHKVRIISTVFGEEIVLPVRRYTITFVNRNDALFDLEMSWDIDAPRSLFDYPPFPQLPPIVIPVPQTPNPCDDLDGGLGWLNGGTWDVVTNHPWLGGGAWVNGDSEIVLRTKKRYGQGYGLIGQHGDGIAGSHTYMYARKKVAKPLKWVFEMEFQVPYYSFVAGYHMAPFPEFSSNIWWGAGSNDFYPQIALDIGLWTSTNRLLACAGNVNNALGFADIPQGTRIRYERNSNGQTRVWRVPEQARPVSAFGTSSVGGGPGISDEPWNQQDFGPNRPWIETAPFTSINYTDYITVMATATGGIGYAAVGVLMPPNTVRGNPFATNGAILGDFLTFTQGPIVTGNNTGYHDALSHGYTARIPINMIRLITLPDDWNFSTQTPVDCVEMLPIPDAGAFMCESIPATSSTEYTTTWAFAAGSTLCSLEGAEMRRGLDYDEDVVGRKLVFRSPIESSAALYVCYTVVS